MQYGIRLKEIRTYDLHTQKEIANELNISENTYTQYELQNKIIPLKYLIKFCDIFNVSIDYVLNLSSNKNYLNSKMGINYNIFLNRLKNLKAELKISTTKLSQEINVPRTTLTGYEKGKYSISLACLYTICKKYHISADYLLGKVDKPKYLK